MSVTAPVCMEAPADDHGILQERSRTLSTQAETVGTTLTTFEQQSAGAMDAMSSTRAQQLFYYVGKATSMLSASQETAAGASTALSDFASDVSDVKEVLETTREKWVDLEYDRRAIDQAYQTWEGMRSLTPPSPDGESPAPGSSTGSGTGTPTLAPPDPWVSPLNPLPVAVSLTRTGSLLGLPTAIDSTNHWSAINQIDTAQAGLVGDAEGEQERYRTAVARATERFDGLYVELDPAEVLFEARMHELDLFTVRTGLTLPELGYESPEEQWQWLLGEGLALREHERRYGEHAGDGTTGPGGTTVGGGREENWEETLRAHGLDGIIGDLRAQYPGVLGPTGRSDTAAEAPPRIEDLPGTRPEPVHHLTRPTGPWVDHGPEPLTVPQFLSYANYLGRELPEAIADPPTFRPDPHALGPTTPQYTHVHRPSAVYRDPMYDALMTGERTALTGGVPQPQTWRTVASAVDLNLFRAVGFVGMVGDAQTLLEGSQYTGMRGAVDYGMAGVGLVSGAAGLASAAGLVTLGTVAAPVTAIAGLAAGGWALGNYLYDNAEQWDDDIDVAQSTVDDWMAEHEGNGLVQALGYAANGGMGLAEVGLKAVDMVGDGLGDLGDALTFWD
ncbi:hypothetical protein [Brevibacterium litoralis]|uniref:hypothetical protein n=1 Tax=Brevibacterium litoralis TaxID=3138935 RepID=UPI0032EF7594